MRNICFYLEDLFFCILGFSNLTSFESLKRWSPNIPLSTHYLLVHLVLSNFFPLTYPFFLLKQLWCGCLCCAFAIENGIVYIQGFFILFLISTSLNSVIISWLTIFSILGIGNKVFSYLTTLERFDWLHVDNVTLQVLLMIHDYTK